MTRLDVVTGFLGAGKTTFLARYLPWLTGQGISYCVIENEFGQAGVDGALLRSGGARVKEISGGCVCCTLKATLHDMLCALSGEVERVVLEPSGLFCGDDLLDVLRSPSLSDKMALGMWTGILDPLSAEAMGEEDTAVLRSEVINAGSLVLSKTQVAGEADMLRVRRLVDALFAGMERPPALWIEPWDWLADDMWFPALLRQGTVIRLHERRLFDHSSMFQSATLRPSLTYDEVNLRDKLAAIVNGDCGQVLRVKGALQAEGGAWWVNCTPGCVDVMLHAVKAQPMLNIIGRDLERGKIKRILMEKWGDCP